MRMALSLFQEFKTLRRCAHSSLFSRHLGTITASMYGCLVHQFPWL